jgi:hypoxanthine-guanine phosphoribosyltransferase
MRHHRIVGILGKVKLVFIAKLVDTLSTDARRNFLIVISRGNGDNDTSKTRPSIFKDVGIS